MCTDEANLKRERRTSEPTLLGLQLIGRGAVPARGQRGGEEHVAGRGLVLRVGEAGVPPPAAQRLVGEGALQGPSGGLREGTGVRGRSLKPRGGGCSRSGFDPHRVSLRRLPRVVHDDQLLQVVLDCAFVGAPRGAQVPQRRPQPRLPENVLGVCVHVPEDMTQN